MRWRTANKNRKRQQRRAVYVAAKAYHEARCARLWRSDRLDKLADSGFVRRHKALTKWLRRAEQAVAGALAEQGFRLAAPPRDDKADAFAYGLAASSTDTVENIARVIRSGGSLASLRARGWAP